MDNISDVDVVSSMVVKADVETSSDDVVNGREL